MVKTLLYDIYKKMEIKDHKLMYVFLEITRKCNLSCIHCGSDCRQDSAAPVLTLPSWLKIIDYFNHNFDPAPFFVVTGGEPLVSPYLNEITAYLKDRRLDWGMVTNGHILTTKRFETLVNHGLKSLTISLDGAKHTHNYLRNNDESFDRVTAALDIIGQSSLEYKDVVTCVHPGNIELLDAIANILIAHNITSWRLFRIFPNGRAQYNRDLYLDHEKTWQMINWIRDNKDRYQEKGLTINLSCEGFLPLRMDRTVRDEPFFCRAGVNIASILSDGTITGCSNNHHSFYEGNMLKDDFGNIWQNGFNKFRKRDWVKQTACKNCQHVKSCRGGSIHLWNLEEDRPHFCYMNKERAAG